MLEKCQYNGQEENTCLQPCSNKWKDCDPDTESCIGNTGFYQKTVTCPSIALKQIVPEAEQTRNLFNLYGHFAAQRKSSNVTYPSTPLAAGRMTHELDHEFTCHCTGNDNQVINGTQRTFYPEDDIFAMDSNDLARELGCLYCPANLIQADSPVMIYETCENPWNPVIVNELFRNQTLFSVWENYPLESRCTCPPGTIFSFSLMYCVERESCLAAEVGVPAGCSMKSNMLIAAGLPPLECDISDPEESMPETYCAKLIDGRFACTDELDQYGNVKNGAIFTMDEGDDQHKKRPEYELEEGEWCSEWFDHNSLMSWDAGDGRIAHNEYERFDSYFFEMIGCDPLKMIISSADQTHLYEEKGRHKHFFGEVEMSLSFYPRHSYNDYPLANFACYSTTEDGSKTFVCKDMKAKFICRDYTPPNYEDHYDNTDATYSHYDMYDANTSDMYSHEMYNYGMDYGDSSGDYNSYSSPRPIGGLVYGEQTTAAYFDEFSSTWPAPTEYTLDEWDIERAVQEIREEQYLMILENYGCTLLWFEFYQAKLYKATNLKEGCVESINEVYDVCLRRFDSNFEFEEWAQGFDYNTLVDHMVSFEKQKFCYSSEEPVIEFYSESKQRWDYEKYKAAVEKYKKELREEVTDPLWMAYASCFDPMAEIMVDEKRYDREVCPVSHMVHECVGKTVTTFLDDWSEKHTPYAGWSKAKRILEEIIMKFSPGCEAYWPAIDLDNCTPKMVLDKSLECSEVYIFPHMPLHDDTPECMLRFGVCVYLQARSCSRYDSEIKSSKDERFQQKVDEIVQEVKRDIPPFAFTIVNLLRQKMPRSLEESIEFGKWAASQFIEGIEERIAKAEKLVGITVNYLSKELFQNLFSATNSFQELSAISRNGTARMLQVDLSSPTSISI